VIADAQAVIAQRSQHLARPAATAFTQVGDPFQFSLKLLEA
jgi:hypothetical protein